jgi:hypothetical protein
MWSSYDTKQSGRQEHNDLVFKVGCFDDGGSLILSPTR